MDRRHTFNTAIAAMMELSNALQSFKISSKGDYTVAKETLETLILMLSPIVPHITQALWNALGHTRIPVEESWPVVDPEALVKNHYVMVFQVNSKVRAEVTVDAHIQPKELEKLALNHDNIKKYTDNHTIVKVVTIPKKLINIVVKKND
jgi:leucyl-tRNA synthetase